MKQLVICAVALVAVALTACQKDKKGQLDPDAMISLRPAQGVKADNPEHLSALEIVKQATEFSGWNLNINDREPIGIGFADIQRDFSTPKLLMWGTSIISMRGEYVPAFIESTDVVLTRGSYDDKTADTIAYISNQVMQDAQKIIKAAYDAGDYATCYAEFDKAFTFIPITGEEWRALKAENKQ